MLRFFVGTLLAQLGAMLLAGSFLLPLTMERALVALFVISLVAMLLALWFSTVSKQLTERRVSAEQRKFARERESLNVSAERAKSRLLKRTQKEIASAERKTRNRANLKVGAAITVAMGFGLIMLFSQMVTLGLLTLTTAGGAVGGYLARGRRDPDAALDGPELRLIDAQELGEREVTPARLDKKSTTDNIHSASK